MKLMTSALLYSAGLKMRVGVSIPLTVTLSTEAAVHPSTGGGGEGGGA